MPFLKQQIELVNVWLAQSALADKRFAGGELKCIAVDCWRTEDGGTSQKFPGILDANFEAQEVTMDDTYPILIYHKILSKRYEWLKDGSQGSRLDYVRETAAVKMVVYGNAQRIKMTREALEALISTNFPDNFPNASIQPLKLDVLQSLLSATNFNSAALWQEEYSIPLDIAPEDIYFSITYNLVSQWRKGCFKICDCDSDYEVLGGDGGVILGAEGAMMAP